MSRYGWAFVNSIVTGAAVTGPDLGIVVNNGGYASSSTTFQLSGSTGSLNGQLNVTGNVIISGTLFAQQYTSTVVSSSIIYTSGSTKFGDDASDTHQFTGSLLNTVSVSSSIGRFGTITGSAITASNISGTNFDINGGAIDNTTIGASTQSSGKFTTLSASSTLDVVGNTNLNANLIVSGNTTLGDTSADIVTVTAQITGAQFDINGGTIDNTAIGATTPNSGKFTTLSASSTLDVAGNTIMAGNLTVSGNIILGNQTTDTITVTSQITGSQFAITGGTINNTSIGATQQSSGRFTTLSASSTLDIVGNAVLTTLTASSLSASGGGTIGGNVVVGGNFTVSGNTIFGNQAADTVTVTAQITGSQFAITGGTINNTSIGATQQSTGQFSTLSASSNLDVGGNTTIVGNLTVSGTIELGNATTDQITVNGDLTVDDTTTLAGGVNYGTATVVAGTSYVPLAADSVIVLTSTSTPVVTLASQSTSRLLYILFQGGSGTATVASGSSSGIVDGTGTTSATVGMSTSARTLTLLYNTNDNKYYVVAQT